MKTRKSEYFKRSIEGHFESGRSRDKLFFLKKGLNEDGIHPTQFFYFSLTKAVEYSSEVFEKSQN